MANAITASAIIAKIMRPRAIITAKNNKSQNISRRRVVWLCQAKLGVKPNQQYFNQTQPNLTQLTNYSIQHRSILPKLDFI